MPDSSNSRQPLQPVSSSKIIKLSTTNIIKSEQTAIVIWLISLVLKRMLSSKFTQTEKYLCIISCVLIFIGDHFDNIQRLHLIKNKISRPSTLLVVLPFYYLKSLDQNWTVGIFNLWYEILVPIGFAFILIALLPKVLSITEAVILSQLGIVIYSISASSIHISSLYHFLLKIYFLSTQLINIKLFSTWLLISFSTFSIALHLNENFLKTDKRKLTHICIVLVYLMPKIIAINDDELENGNLFLFTIGVLLSLGLLLVQIILSLLQSKFVNNWLKSQNTPSKRFCKTTKIKENILNTKILAFKFFNTFADSKDYASGKLFLITPISAILAFNFAQSFTTRLVIEKVQAIHHENRDHQENLHVKFTLFPLISILAIGIGDTFAAIIGSRFGKLKVTSFSQKSYVGIIASIIAQMVFLFAFIHITSTFTMVDSKTRIATFHYLQTAFLPIVITSIVESLTFQIDNFITPLVMMSLLL